MKKVIILGALGMAGHIMAEHLNSLNKYEIYGVARFKDTEFISKALDVKDTESLKNYIEEIKPDFIINCIGVLVSKSKSDIASAIQINSYLPHYLSELGNKLKFKLIHISTDCVFSGKDGQYTEDSFRDGDDNYARTKALGEVINNRDLTIRTSIIGAELKVDGSGLLDWFLRQEENVSGYCEAYWSGVTTLELAKQTDAFLEQEISGLYHLCPLDKISKYDLLEKFSTVWQKKIRIEKDSSYKIDKSLVCTIEDFIYKDSRPTYENMLNELKSWMDVRQTLYNHYENK